MKGIAESKDGMSRMLVSRLNVGSAYTLDNLASLIGQQTNALRGKGVITKSGSDFQFLMITLEKDQWATSGYIDHLDGYTLFWSGQNKLKSAEEKIQSGMFDTFFFIQEKRRTPYIYYGRAIPLRTHIIWERGIPSHIVFDLPEYKDYLLSQNKLTQFDIFSGHLESMEEDNNNYSYVAKNSEKEVFTKIRLTQSKYRKNVIEFWNGNCSVTGVDEPSWLIASHIKPWRESTNEEKTDPHNSLLLTPNYDKLFDRGVISFSPSDGKILLPETQSKQMWANFNRMHINEDIKLRYVPKGIEQYLEYHNQYIYGFNPTDEKTEDIVESLLAKGLA